MTTTQHRMLTQAMTFLVQGWSVFPCGWNKHPLVARGFHAASRDEEQVRQWWGQWPHALVGAPTGRANGVLVLDADVDKDRGINGLDALHWLPNLPDTLEATTPRGGRHYYLRLPSGLYIPSSASKLGPGIDIRCEGGYVILPGSITRRGRYDWDEHNPPQMAEVPRWLIERAQRERPQEVRREYTGDRADVSEVRSALAHLSPDAEYDEWVSIGMALHSWDQDAGYALWDEWSAQGSKYVGPTDLDGHWNSFRAEGNSSGVITIASVFRRALDLGWENPQHRKLVIGGSSISSLADLPAISNSPTEPDGLLTAEAPPMEPKTPQSIAEQSGPDYPLRVELASEWAVDLTPPEYLIDGMIERGTYSAIIGSWSAGKTAVWLDIVLRMCHGMPVHGRTVLPGWHLWVVAEGQAGFRRRIAAWHAHHRLPITDKLWLITQSVPISDPAWARRLYDTGSQLSDRMGAPPLSTSLDTFIANFGPGDENSNSDVARVVEATQAVTVRPWGCATMVVHHTGHGNKERGRGGSALPAALDTEFLAWSQAPGWTGLRAIKMKDDDASDLGDLYWRLSGVPVPGTGRTSVVATPTEEEPPQQEGPTPTEARLLGLFKLWPPGADIDQTAWRQKAEVELDMKGVVFRQHFKRMKDKGLVEVVDNGGPNPWIRPREAF